jgi:hypothetical protein
MSHSLLPYSTHSLHPKSYEYKRHGVFYEGCEGCDFRFFDYIKTKLGLHFYTQKTSNNNNPNISKKYGPKKFYKGISNKEY